ncbi:MAG: N-(5'-phosphoribosyl)anthranilate isomerase [Paracoccaceae bacterium]
MSFLGTISDADLWIGQLFSAQAVAKGGVIRRSIWDAERKVWRRRLELEVRRRGFHMLECGGQFIIVCSAETIRIIC